MKNKLEKLKQLIPLLKSKNKEDRLLAKTIIDGTKDISIFKIICCINVPYEIVKYYSKKAYGKEFPRPWILMEMNGESSEIKKFIIKYR